MIISKRDVEEVQYPGSEAAYIEMADGSMQVIQPGQIAVLIEPPCNCGQCPRLCVEIKKALLH